MQRACRLNDTRNRATKGPAFTAKAPCAHDLLRRLKNQSVPPGTWVVVRAGFATAAFESPAKDRRGSNGVVVSRHVPRPSRLRAARLLAPRNRLYARAAMVPKE